MRELLLLRHGVTEANERRVFTGASDIPLSPRGEAALRPLLGTYPQAVLFFTSGMLRARQTLALLYGDVESITIPELSEYRFGQFEGRAHPDLYETEPIYRQWLLRERDDIACPGGESFRAFDTRVGEGWRKLLSHDWNGRAVLVSHGGVIAALIRLFAPEREWVHPPDNACGYRVWLSARGEISEHEAFP